MGKFEIAILSLLIGLAVGFVFGEQTNRPSPLTEEEKEIVERALSGDYGEFNDCSC